MGLFKDDANVIMFISRKYTSPKMQLLSLSCLFPIQITDGPQKFHLYAVYDNGCKYYRYMYDKVVLDF